ncbi:thioltransferase [Nosema bombycis CQ1]|uniref:Thioltransferase n=1 Tax=Nosema bombycis (strain CQ1 / CVCC 102059) TaxID=578461 RepID=R0M0B0_NOSB1|nr:thioltransferase [Nosema bombycis CQ1]|eukprot:EOB11434.1 thioltransferase [Nosema bombycis CQ1]
MCFKLNLKTKVQKNIMSKLQELINQKTTFILTMDKCSDTVKGLEILNNHKVDYISIKKEENPELVEDIIREYNFKYYPTIFINGEFIGGDKELNLYLNNK